MKIRTKLEISTLSVFVGALLIGAVLFVTASEINKATEDSRRAIEILQKITQINTLKFGDFTDYSEKMNLEWVSQNTALFHSLSQSFRNPQQQVVVRNMRYNQQDMLSLFDQISMLPAGQLIEVKGLTLRDSLQLKWQSLLEDAFILNRITQTEIEATERTANAFIFISIGMLGVLVVAISFLIRKNVIDPVARLHHGVKIVGDGNLKFRSKISSNDEIGELAQAFDSMAAKLGAFYETLEEKVRQRSEEILEKNLLLQSLIDNAPVGVTLIKAPTDEILMMNRVGDILLGGTLGMEKPIGKHFSDCSFRLDDGTEYPKENLPYMVTLKTGEIITKDDLILNQQPTGKQMTLRMTSAPVKNPEGKLTSVVILWEDITERKHLESMKNQFLSFAAHQLRTPLGSIRWNLEMLLKGDAGVIPDAAQENLEQISECNQRMIKRVNELLDVSMIEEGKWHDQVEKVNIIPMVEDALNEVAIDAKVKNITLNLNKPPQPLPSVKIGPKRFYQALINLLSNAIKYNRQDGSVSVDFQVTQDMLQMVISDTGIGIPNDDQSKIFTKFFRAKNAILQETEGTGLGLFLIKSYMEKWGGRIYLKSEEGKYTKYYLEFKIDHGE